MSRVAEEIDDDDQGVSEAFARAAESITVLRRIKNRGGVQGRMAAYARAVPQVQQEYEARHDAYYLQLNTALREYAEQQKHNNGVDQVIDGLVGLLSTIPEGHLRRGVNNVCSLLASGAEPVLIRSAIFHISDDDGWFDSDLDSTIITRIRKVLVRARKELDLEAVFNAPLEMVSVLLDERLREEFGESRREEL